VAPDDDEAEEEVDDADDEQLQLAVFKIQLRAGAKGDAKARRQFNFTICLN